MSSTRKINYQSVRSGFALPTILISSVVMIIVLLAAIQVSVSISNSLQGQYQQRLLTTAAESGMNYAQSCLENNLGAVWTQSLKTNTNCNGVEALSCPASATDTRCSVLNTSQVRTRFEVATPVVTGQTMEMKITSYLDLKRASGSTSKTLNYSRFFSITQTRDLAGERATQRYWYVGRTGSTKFDFGSTGTSEPVLTSYPSGPSFGEGLTVITDITGKHLFTTNGIEAYDAANKVMPGSSGGLGATGSTTQGVVAFPINGNRYMVIGNSAGADGVNPANPGDYGILKKSIINMNLVGSNGSVGDVEPGSLQSLTRATLNVVAGSSHAIATEPNGTETYTGQFMTAAPEKNGNGYWLVFGTPGRPYFYAVLFDNGGNVKKVVRSPTPANVPIPVCKINPNPGAWRASFGTMRFNKAYDKLIVYNGTNGCDTTDTTRKLPSNYNGTTYRDVGWMYLRSFNNETGEIGNVYSTAANQYWSGSVGCAVAPSVGRNVGYAADFSPNEDYVYQATIYPGKLYRFRITGSDIASGATTIFSTAQFIGNTDNFNADQSYNPAYPRGGQVRRAPNGKMYVANQFSPSISSISNPDGTTASSVSSTCAARAANFSYNSLPLGTGITSGLGLPDYNTRYVPQRILY